MKVLYETDTVDHDRELAAQRRHANLEAKMHKSPSAGVPHAPGAMVPIPELQAVRSAQGIGSTSQLAAYIAIYYGCRRSDSSKQIDQMLGTGTISFPQDGTMLGMPCPKILLAFSL